MLIMITLTLLVQEVLEMIRIDLQIALAHQKHQVIALFTFEKNIIPT